VNRLRRGFRRIQILLLAAGLLAGGAVFSLQAFARTPTSALTNRDAAYVPASITGTIADSSGNPVTTQDICVTAYSSDGGDGYGYAQADATGSYVITGLVPDSYDVNASDCVDDSRNDAPTFYSTAADGSATAVAVSGGQTQTGIDIKMAPGASISGTIEDSSGAAITTKDVCVDAYSSTGGDGYGYAQSDANGNYTITRLVPGSYDVQAYDCAGSSRNDLPTNYSTAADGSVTAVAVSVGQAQAGIDIKMAPGASISGTIEDASGTAITTQDVCVDAYSSVGGAGYGYAQTDASGNYTITRLVPGSYDVQAYDCAGSSRNDVPTFYGTAADGSVTAVAISGGQAHAGIDIKMAPGASISGTIEDSSGAAITTKDVCVDAYSSDGGAGYGYAQIDASGNYTITRLVPGSYDVQAYDCVDDSRNDLQTYYGQSASNPNGTAITLASGQAQTGDDIRMQPATSITGHVYGGSGTSAPLSGACVIVRDASGDTLTQTQSAADGSYELKGLAPGGAVTVEFTPCGAGASWSFVYYADSLTLAGATSITPTLASPATGIDGHLPATGSISGTITDASGQPVASPDGCISAGLTTGGLTRYARTDSSGTYLVTGLAAGSYYVKAYDCRTSARNDLPTYYSTTADGKRTAVAVLSGATTGSIDVQMGAGTSISGHVYGGAGSSTPLSDACVSAFRAAGGGSGGSVDTAADGTYSIHRLVPAVAYDVYFSPCGGASSGYIAEYYDGSPTQSTATTVTPTVAGPTTGIDAHLTLGGTISGEIADPSGKPITTGDICVTASATDGSDNAGALTTSSGSYTITGLPANSYDIHADPCYGPTSVYIATYYSTSADGSPTAVAVTSGQTVDAIDIQMQASTSISGHVYSGTGTAAPVSGVCVTAYVASSGTKEGYATTGSDGSYQITALTPDTGYKVGFQPCSSGSLYAPQYYNGENSLATADVVTPSATNPSTGIDAHLAGGASITGTVADASGNPITSQDVCVAAYPATGGFGGSDATTTAAGQYAITGLSPGSYYVHFTDCANSARNDVAQYYGGVPDQNDSSLVVLSTGGTATGVSAAMQTGTSIVGHAYAGPGTASPLAKICVDVQATAGSGTDNYYYYFYGETDSSGAYDVGHIAPISGGYRVEFVDCNLHVEYVSQYYGGNYASSTASVVSPTVPTPLTGVDAHLDFGGSISGTITDSTGALVTSGVCADAQMSGATYYYGYTYSLTASGGYAIGGLPTGNYNVSFYDCGTRNDLPGKVASPVAVTLGVATTGADVTLAPATSISGTVYGGSGTGAPLANVCVQAVAPGTGNTDYGSAETAGNGAYEIEHLPPGGSYAVEFNTCPSGEAAGYAMQYYDGVSALSQAATLSPTLVTPSTGIDAHLPTGAPVATITGGPASDAATSQTDASFSFVANQAGATFKCALDGSAYTSCTSPDDTGALGAGPHTFSVEAIAGGLTEVSPAYVHWTVDTTSPTSSSQGEVTAGGSFSSAPGQQTSATNPVIVGVTPPADSQVTLTTEPTTTPSGNGYTIFGEQVDISAAQPDGTGSVTGTTANPIQLVFTVDASQLPAGTPIDQITVTRNGTPAPACAAQDGTASPDPCVESRTSLTGGDIQIVVLTTHASTWNLATTSATVAGPVNTAMPAAPAGTVQQGQTLTAAVGSWSGSPTGFAYQWQNCDASGAGCSPIAGATAPTYVLTASDVGRTIRVQVVASNAGGPSTPALSAATATVQAAAVGPGGGGSEGGGGTPSTGGGGAPSPNPGGSGAIPPSPGSATATIGPVVVKGTSATVTVRCAGAKEASCKLVITLIATEVVTGGKVVAVIATKAERKTITLGSKSATLAAGTSASAIVALNGKGKHLLSSLRRLHVKLSVTEAGQRTAGYVKTLTFTMSTKRPKRPH
jgi:protocatechuate 3,4-dioxygenase beta subunit